jgi:threonine dehydratase
VISKDQIIKAHERIKPFIHKTPVHTNQTINKLTGSDLYFKCENFQKIGAFKIRGAMNAVLSLSKDKLLNGIATHSSGNHAQAIAYAARVAGTHAYIVMPENSPKVKVEAVKSYGATIYFCEPTLQARETTLNAIVEKTGAEFIHPYNDYRVITGQATCAKELIEDHDNLDFIIVPVGGGGLLSGTLLSAQFFSFQTAVYAGEPEGAADAVLSIRSGKIEKAPFIDTIADGLLTTLGDKTFPIIQQFVKEILVVNDKEIIAAMRLVYERMKMVIEPSAAVPLAALIKHNERFTGKKGGIIISGGNADLGKISGWLGY